MKTNHDLTKNNLTSDFYIRCDFLPLLLNHSKAVFRGRLIKTKKAREFESLLISTLMENYKHLRNFQFKTHELHLILIIGSPKFLTKNGIKSKKSGDIDGFVKHTTDIVFKTLLPHLDDSQVIRLSVELAKSSQNQFHLVLKETGPLVEIH